MKSRKIARILALVLVIPLLGVVVPGTSALAQRATAVVAPGSDIRELGHKSYTLDGQPVENVSSYRANSARVLAAAETPAVGTVRQWLALDDFNAAYYRKDYTLRGVGDNIEVWVANDIAFPAGDCRTQIPSSTVITDEQVNYLVGQFDTNIYPKETATFSTPPDRDGSNAQLGPDKNGNGGDYSGGGNKTVTLVDNVRDDNFYDFPAAPTYIAGFFSSALNDLFDRNVMTIDAFDWLHRTGANPPNEPTADLCTSRPGRPNLYEGTFAHEWQHLLHFYTDPFETTWLNEGLSDFAQTLTGYVDATRTVFDRGANSHLYCFQGFGPVATQFNTNPRDCGGPENSLNLWDEGSTANAVLADYGNAYSFMLFLYDRYGTAFMSRLHQDGALQGLASLDAALEAEGVHDTFTVIHDFQTMTLVDKIVGESKRGRMLGVSKSRVTTKSLRSTINLANPAINSTPGVAPNGADYVLLQNATAQTLRGRDLKSFKFAGATTLPAIPLAWQSISDDPDRAGNPVLFSGNENSTDATGVAAVTVPTDNPTLRLLEKYGAEQGFDYGYVTVSTDGGQTYTAIRGDKTVDGPLGPSVNGTTVGFEPHSYDLSAYAGQSILLGFRYVSDGGVNEGGWLLDDITVGSTSISDGSSLEPFRSPSEIRPTPVANWNIRLIGISDRCSVAKQVEIQHRSNVTLSRHTLRMLAGFPKVVVIVSYDEPTEQYSQYAPYTLTVNGVLQPGGAPLS